MFLDEIIIDVEAGNGGDGAVAFRREKYVPRGGPSGGDGGRGGHVFLVVDRRVNTLTHFKGRPRHAAVPGQRGRNKNQTGATGADLELLVPPGTLVRDATTGTLLADLIEPGQRVCVAKGGRGGRGNARFANARNQTPRVAEKGDAGEHRRLKLELKLIADVGIVGKPNAGKSTLLAASSQARPKIADYPFTTLEPYLGVVDLGDYRTLVLADIPGLIEGAHLGAGLGHAFLRHIERTRILIHLLDGAGEDPLTDFHAINAELRQFSARLAAKPQIVVMNKLDLPQAREHLATLTEALAGTDYQVRGISAVTGEGVRELLWEAARLVAETPPATEPELTTIGLADVAPVDEHFTVTRAAPGQWHVKGPQIERLARRVSWEHEEAVDRFQSTLERLEVRQALEAAGVVDGDTVFIGDIELEWRD